ncbi:MAG TPA: BPSS1780 family membrane protein [Rhodocyclaceae bacterium]|nr:BPSS1780 family membrane protein [Rhodocyclaceae bacterium]
MSEQNPFVVPSAYSAAGNFAPEGRSVDAGRAIEWLKLGWGYFLKNPGIWIAMTVVLMVITVVLSMIPLVGHLALNFLMPVLVAGLLLGCKALRDGGELRFDHLFAGFKQNTGNLIMVSVYYLIGVVAIGIVTFLVGGGAAFTGAMMGNVPGMGVAAGGFLLAMLIMLVLMVPLAMAVWFAPALVVFRDVAPVPALKASFAACLKNMLPFLVFGIVVMVLGFVASLPIFLGWLVLLPALVGAHYSSYLDIFE